MKCELALVTGASSGLGSELCRLLAKKKIPLLISGRDTERLHKIAAELKGSTEVEIIPADLLDKKAKDALITRIHQKGPDLVINCAGFGIYGEVLSTSTKEQLQILELNGNAPIEIAIEAARTLYSKKKEGIILNVSSVAGFYTFPTLAMYAAAKDALTHFSESFDWEMRPYGIRILASCPGQIETAFIQKAGGREDYPRSWSMTKEYAAKAILKQIEQKKGLKIIDFRYRLALFFTRFAPKSLLTKKLVAEIERRSVKKELLQI